MWYWQLTRQESSESHGSSFSMKICGTQVSTSCPSVTRDVTYAWTLNFMFTCIYTWYPSSDVHQQQFYCSFEDVSNRFDGNDDDESVNCQWHSRWASKLFISTLRVRGSTHWSDSLDVHEKRTILLTRAMWREIMIIIFIIAIFEFEFMFELYAWQFAALLRSSFWIFIRRWKPDP